MMKSFKLQWRYDVDKRAVALGVAAMVVGLTGLYFAGQAKRESEKNVSKAAVASVPMGETVVSPKPSVSPSKQDNAELPTEFAAAGATALVGSGAAPGNADGAIGGAKLIAMPDDEPGVQRPGKVPMVGESFVMRREDVVEVQAAAEKLAAGVDPDVVSRDADANISIAPREAVAIEQETAVAITSEGGKDEVVAASKSVDVLYEWSTNKLERIRNKKAKQHRFAKNYPDHAIVVCEAGCRGSVEQIVFKKPKPPRYAERQARMIATAGKDVRLAGAARSKSIDCLAGCYVTPRSYHPRRKSRRVARRAQYRPAMRRSWR